MAKFLQIILGLAFLGKICLAGDDWSEFKLKHGLSYENQFEETMRKSIFNENKAYIERFNAEQSELVGYRLGINKFADRTQEELKNFGGFKGNIARSRSRIDLNHLLSKALLKVSPSEVDWTKVAGRVTSVKDEGNCRASWVFSAVGALEGQMTVQNKTLASLSEQNVIDCSTSNHGCDRGDMADVWLDIGKEGGIEGEQTYPYRGVKQSCSFNKSRAIFTSRTFYDLPPGDEIFLHKVVAAYGPVSVGVDSTQDSFKFYKDGIYFDNNCSSYNVDQALLAVGYGVDEKTGSKYWLLKNSWGTSWGMNGYMKLARDRDDHCGIADWGMIPLF